MPQSMKQPEFPMPDIASYLKYYSIEGVSLAGICSDGLPLFLAVYTKQNELSTTRPVVVVSDSPESREGLLKVMVHTWNISNDNAALEWGADGLLKARELIVRNMGGDGVPFPVMVVVRDADRLSKAGAENLEILRAWARVSGILLVVSAGAPIEGYQEIVMSNGVWHLPEHDVSFYSWSL